MRVDSKQLPIGWSVLTIEDISDVNPRLNKSEIPDDLDVSFVPMPAVGAANGSIDVSEERPFQEVKKGFTAFKEGDVLFAKITPCMENGKMALVPKLKNDLGFGSTEFHVLRPKEGADARYIYYYVSSKKFRGEAERYMTGAVGQRRVTTPYLKECEIPLAPPEQQKRIVAEIEKQFSRLDEAVANLKRVKANLKRYKATVLKAAVEGKLTEEWRKQHPEVEPASKLLERILAERHIKWEEAELSKMKAKGKVPKDDKWKKKYKEPNGLEVVNLPVLTDSWIWVSLDQLLSLLRNGISKKPTEEKGLAILRISAVRPLLVSMGDIRFFPKSLLAEYKDFVLKEDDLLFTRYNGNPPFVGVCGRVPRTTVPTVHPDKLIRGIVVSNQLVSPAYIEIAVNSGMSREFIARRVRTTAGQSGISGGDLKQVPIPLPSVKEQLGIVAEVDCMIGTLKKTMEEVDKQLERAERLRQSILRRAFSGTLNIGRKDTSLSKECA